VKELALDDLHDVLEVPLLRQIDYRSRSKVIRQAGNFDVVDTVEEAF
jgi:hypothetical protein